MTYEVKCSTTRDVLSSHATLDDAMQAARLVTNAFVLAHANEAAFAELASAHR